VTEKELIQKAKEALPFAYAPYSGYSVGAALLTADGSVYTGVNIENASYGATLCAERVAAFKAVSEGHTKFEALALVTGSGDFPTPCGMCRQVLSEFCDGDMRIILHNDEKTEIWRLEELLPLSFTGKNLREAASHGI